MQFTILLGFLLTSTLVAALPAVKRDAAAVLSDLSKLTSDVSNLTTIVNTYTGAANETGPFVIGFGNLKVDIESLTSNVKSSGDFNSADASSISNTIQNLTPAIVNILVNLMQKVNYFSLSY